MTSSQPGGTLFRVGVEGSKEGLHIIRAVDQKSAIEQWRKEHGGKAKAANVSCKPDSDFDVPPKG